MSGDAFVDSSSLVAIALREPAARAVADRMRRFAKIYAHALLEAEVRSACVRESVPPPDERFATISWTQTPLTLSAEIDRVLAAGYLRGADCWHVATALFLAPDPRQLTFLTLDVRQRAVAKKLGFKV